MFYIYIDKTGNPILTTERFNDRILISSHPIKEEAIKNLHKLQKELQKNV